MTLFSSKPWKAPGECVQLITESQFKLLQLDLLSGNTEALQIRSSNESKYIPLLSEWNKVDTSSPLH